jgi:hypothetical protein
MGSDIELEAFTDKASKLEKDVKSSKMNHCQQMSTQSSGNQKNNDRADKEVGEGKGKNLKRKQCSRQ